MSNPFEKDWCKTSTQETKPARHADITVVFDRSSSMQTMQEGVVEGFNDFVRSMQTTPGDSRWTLVQFDDPDSAKGGGEAFPQVLFENRPETNVPFLALGETRSGAIHSGQITTRETYRPTDREVCYYQPRGSTALVDALYTTIERAQQRTSGQDTQVIMTIITDGKENASRQHTNADLRQLIAQTQSKGWQYIYLGANQDSFAQSSHYGIATQDIACCGGLLAAGASNKFNYVPTNAGIRQAIASGMMGTAAIVSGKTQ